MKVRQVLEQRGVVYIYNIYVLSELVQGRLREGKKTYAFFLDVQKLMIRCGVMVSGLRCGS